MSPSKKKKATRSTYLPAGSLTALKNSLQGTRKSVQAAKSKNENQKYPRSESAVQEQDVQQVPLDSTSPVEQQLRVSPRSKSRVAQELQRQLSLRSTISTGAIPKARQKLSLRSTSSGAQVILKNGQQASLHSTAPTVGEIPENGQKDSQHSTSVAAQVVPEAQEVPEAQVVPENEQHVTVNTASGEINEQSTKKGPSIEKRKRGRTEMQRVHGRTERKLIVLNKHNQPIGPTIAAVHELSSFLGTLARNSTFCPLTIRNWKKVNTKNDMWKYVKEKYNIPDVGKKWVLKTIQDAWRTYKSRLKRRHFKAYTNDEDRMKNRPQYVSESEFKALLDYWNSDEVQKTSRINTENRKKLRYPHTVGKRSFAIIREEKQKESTDALTKKDIFVATRTRKPDRVYKESYEDTIHKIAEMERIQTHEEGEEGEDGPVDAFGSVMGPERPGRVRLYGRGVTKKILKDKVEDPAESSATDLVEQKIKEMEERMTQKVLEKLEVQRDVMQQEMAVNIITRLQRLNPGLQLQLDPEMAAFCARFEGEENSEGEEDGSMDDLRSL